MHGRIKWVALLIPSLITLCQRDAITEVAVPRRSAVRARRSAPADPRRLGGSGASVPACSCLGTAWVLDQSERISANRPRLSAHHPRAGGGHRLWVYRRPPAGRTGQHVRAARLPMVWGGACPVSRDCCWVSLFCPGVTGGVRPLFGRRQNPSPLPPVASGVSWADCWRPW